MSVSIFIKEDDGQAVLTATDLIAGKLYQELLSDGKPYTLALYTGTTNRDYILFFEKNSCGASHVDVYERKFILAPAGAEVLVRNAK